MAQASKRLKRLRRLKRVNSKLRQTVRVIPGMVAEQLNKAYGELLPLVYALLIAHGDWVKISHEEMEYIRRDGPKLKYTVEPDADDPTVTIVRLVRPTLTVTKVPEPVDVPPVERVHEPGCPAIADDESDEVLADYGECACGPIA